MKVRYTTATGCPVGQFVIEAENEQDRTILAHFVDFRDPHWIFWKHGATYKGMESGCSSFNFGYIKRPAIVTTMTKLGWKLHGLMKKWGISE